jgi:hypothetical protein
MRHFVPPWPWDSLAPWVLARQLQLKLRRLDPDGVGSHAEPCCMDRVRIERVERVELQNVLFLN